MARETYLISSGGVGGRGGVLVKERTYSPILGGLFLPLVKKHLTVNVPWKCIFSINRSIITVDSVYKMVSGALHLLSVKRCAQ